MKSSLLLLASSVAYGSSAPACPCGVKSGDYCNFKFTGSKYPFVGTCHLPPSAPCSCLDCAQEDPKCATPGPSPPSPTPPTPTPPGPAPSTFDCSMGSTKTSSFKVANKAMNPMRVELCALDPNVKSCAGVTPPDGYTMCSKWLDGAR